jgi:hypothetical protein
MPSTSTTPCRTSARRCDLQMPVVPQPTARKTDWREGRASAAWRVLGHGHRQPSRSGARTASRTRS